MSYACFITLTGWFEDTEEQSVIKSEFYSQLI